MDINNNYWISARRDCVETNLYGSREQILATDARYNDCAKVLKIMKKRTWSDEYKNKQLIDVLSTMFADPQEVLARSLFPTAVLDMDYPVDRAQFKQLAQKMINFFSEFNIDPSIRFIDTFIRRADRKQYVCNYFKLCDSPWVAEINDKVKSSEFDSMCELADQIKLNPFKRVNNHLKIFFGPAGTGKTTAAMKDAVGCIPCSSDMDCKELLKDFKFKDGAPTFEKSAFWIAIEEGKTVVLDEVNLLNRQVLQFLQALTDGKEYVDFEGTRINIHPKFMAIGTMNLIVNGMTFALSEPLVDRCSEIVEYKLTADGITDAILGPEA